MKTLKHYVCGLSLALTIIGNTGLVCAAAAEDSSAIRAHRLSQLFTTLASEYANINYDTSTKIMRYNFSPEKYLLFDRHGLTWSCATRSPVDQSITWEDIKSVEPKTYAIGRVGSECSVQKAMLKYKALGETGRWEGHGRYAHPIMADRYFTLILCEDLAVINIINACIEIVQNNNINT